MSSTSREQRRESTGEATAAAHAREPASPGAPFDKVGSRRRPRLPVRLRTLLLVPAIAVFVLLALVVRLGPFAFAMVEGDGAATTTGVQLEGAPYSERGPHQVGTRRLVIDGEPSLAATLWYPAAAGGREARTTYAYELKLFAPVGTLAIATYEGRAGRNAP